MTLKAGYRIFIARVEYHNGNLLNGEPTYNIKEDWITYIDKMPVRYRGVSPGQIGGEMNRGQQIEAIVTGMIEVLATPRTRGILPTMRFIIDSRVLNITNIYDPGGMMTDLSIQVKELT